MKYTIEGNIFDALNSRIYKGIIEIEDGFIISITENDQINSNNYILPGFIDSHVHIESSMLIPSEFARLAVVHGTVATVSDPHEIANVLGIDGVRFMIENGKQVPFKFYFGAPSCVPATPFETSGAVLGFEEIEELMKMDEIKYMGEMMNFPGVLFQDKEVMAKLAIAKKYNKPIDGHAPNLSNTDAELYINSGISTDHECFTIAEAEEKLKLGMKVLIREGSAAKNFDELISLVDLYPNQIMLCSDDKHPDDLVNGHLNLLIKRALAKGCSLMNVIRSLTVLPVKHYNLPVGLLQKGDSADFVIVDNLKDFAILKTYINGKLIAENGKTLVESVKSMPINKFEATTINIKDLFCADNGKKIKVIEALEGQLITNQLLVQAKAENENIISDIENDVLKLVVINRYEKSKPAIGFIKNFGFKKGAIASTVAHDSHNIIAVGTSDEELCKAINLLIESKGGIIASDGANSQILPLPFAGLMSGEDGYLVATKYEQIDAKAKELGSKLQSPFMTLSFMALLVIPQLKLSDKGLFDGNNFSFTDIYE
ncbi:MAG: adenine deaminase [Bacteroidota bacterium]